MYFFGFINCKRLCHVFHFCERNELYKKINQQVIKKNKYILGVFLVKIKSIKAY